MGWCSNIILIIRFVLLILIIIGYVLLAMSMNTIKCWVLISSNDILLQL